MPVPKTYLESMKRSAQTMRWLSRLNTQTGSRANAHDAVHLF